MAALCDLHVIASTCDAAGKIEGDFRINGHPKVQATFACVSGYAKPHTATANVQEL